MALELICAKEMHLPPPQECTGVVCIHTQFLHESFQLSANRLLMLLSRYMKQNPDFNQLGPLLPVIVVGHHVVAQSGNSSLYSLAWPSLRTVLHFSSQIKSELSQHPSRNSF